MCGVTQHPRSRKPVGERFPTEHVCIRQVHLPPRFGLERVGGGAEGKRCFMRLAHHEQRLAHFEQDEPLVECVLELRMIQLALCQ